jgi:hypothetical protein
MRVTIKIDDQNVSVSQAGADEQPPSAPTLSGLEPPAELAARAEALGAISAGSAPVHAPGGLDPGAPGINIQSAEPDQGLSRETDAIAAGAAPGQPDVTESVEALEEG